MRLFLTLAMMVLSSSTVWAQTAPSGNPVLEDCQLSLLPENYIEISADKEGILQKLSVREGTIVREGDVIGQIDDAEPQMQLKVAAQKLLAAKAKALDKIEEQYAQAASDAAQADYESLDAANKSGIDRVVPETELRAKKLEWVRAQLQILKAQKDRELAKYDYLVAKVEEDAANLEINRRVVKSPLAGQVVKLFRKQGEWVDPGESILQMARYDVLQCDGNVNLAQYDPRDIEGCEVTIEATVGGGRKEVAKGRITYVEQQVMYDGNYTYRVVAEVPNRVDRDRWALYPGLRVKMNIHLGTANQNMSSRIEGR
ncbi:efflux RND transporter periplasmic adaptor subunit [Aeoliella sp. SH292]|uniref:efflux RND transporter periplasmic adaptor subunit n=1 Tax=Aeoliella sp. SH292 TaxID=3454464 RepID=UPI003F9A50D9